MKGCNWNYQIIFGSQLSHLATQEDSSSCGLYVCEYMRRLFLIERLDDPIARLQPVCISVTEMRRIFSATLATACQRHNWRTSASSHGGGAVLSNTSSSRLGAMSYRDCIGRPAHPLMNAEAFQLTSSQHDESITGERRPGAQQINRILQEKPLYCKNRERRLVDMAMQPPCGSNRSCHKACGSDEVTTNQEHGSSKRQQLSQKLERTRERGDKTSRRGSAKDTTVQERGSSKRQQKAEKLVRMRERKREKTARQRFRRKQNKEISAVPWDNQRPTVGRFCVPQQLQKKQSRDAAPELSNETSFAEAISGGSKGTTPQESRSFKRQQKAEQLVRTRERQREKIASQRSRKKQERATTKQRKDILDATWISEQEENTVRVESHISSTEEAADTRRLSKKRNSSKACETVAHEGARAKQRKDILDENWICEQVENTLSVENSTVSSTDEAAMTPLSPWLASANKQRLDVCADERTRERAKKRRRRLTFSDDTTSHEVVNEQPGNNVTSTTETVLDNEVDEQSVCSRASTADTDLGNATTDDSALCNETFVRNKRLHDFFRLSSDTPTYPCIVCHQLKFKAHIAALNANDRRISEFGHPYPIITAPFHICRSCANSIRTDKLPKLAAKRVKMPQLPEELKGLGRLERTLLALRIPFMTIRSLPRGGQISVKGNFVNIPVTLQTSMNSIPRSLSATETVVVKFKRRMRYKSAYIHEVVRVDAVLNAARYLVSNSPLYKEERATVDDQWSGRYGSLLDGAELFEGFDEHASRGVEDLISRYPFSSSDVTAIAKDTYHDPDCNYGVCVNTENREKPTDKLVDSDDDWEEEAPQAETQIPPGETVTADPYLTDVPHWDICMAPGEESSPVSLFGDRNTMAKSFPTVFGGQGMPNLEELGISWPEFSKWLLGYLDRRVPITLEVIFFLLKVVQVKQLSNAVQVAMRRGNSKGQVTVRELLSPEGLEAFVRSDDGYHVLKNIRGSPSYWKRVQSEVFAMVRQLGKPTFFISLSAAETRWPELLQSLSRTVDNVALSLDEASGLSWETKCRLIRSDPDTCVVYFDSRFKAFTSIYLKKGKVSTLGTVEDSVYRVEFQQRGSPHIRSLWWMKDAPAIGHSSDEEVAEYVDKLITCAVPDSGAEAVTYQNHRHSKTCKRYDGRRLTCRFNFPKPPMRKTMLLRPLEDELLSDAVAANEKTIAKLLQQLWREPRDINFVDFLEELQISEEDYILAVRSKLKRAEVFLRRSCSEIRINAYNMELLKAWRANMDIQYVLHPYAAARYIVSYMLKSQRGLSFTMRSVVKEVSQGNMSLWSRLRKVSNTFLNCVEISEQEAVWMIRQMPMYRCSRDCIFVSASPLAERVVLLKPIAELKRMKEGNEESRDIECDNIIKRYQRRPLLMEKLSLATFATWFDCVKPRPSSFSQEDPDDCGHVEEAEIEDGCTSQDAIVADEPACAYKKQLSNLPSHIPFDDDRVLRKRKHCKVLRSPRFWENKDKEKHFFEKLMLYVPWRDEAADLNAGNYGTLENKWLDAVQRSPLIVSVMLEHDKMGPILDSIIDEVQEDINREEDVPSRKSAVAGNVQHIDELDEAAVASANNTVEMDRNIDLMADAGFPPLSAQVELRARRLEESNYHQIACALNCEQKRLFYDILYRIRTNSNPLRLFISGGAGVAKSYLLKAVYQALIRHYRHINATVDPDSETVLLVAPTGKAAHLINGFTAHNILRIPANQSLKQYRRLDADKLNTLRHDLNEVKVVIIDEVSMIGYNLFRYIDMRFLRDLVDVSTRSFGGLHVVCFGDLFQLRPVKDSYVFQVSSESYLSLVDNLWREFQMSELEVIMRQKDDVSYAKLLNRLREGLQTEEDVRQLFIHNANGTSLEELISTGTVFLCKTNDRANTINDARLQSCCGLKRSFVAIDKHEDKHCDLLLARTDERFTGGLPSILCAAVGMRVEITINIDTSDGLTNGASGSLEGFSKKIPNYYWSKDVIWVRFADDYVGARRRQKLKFLYCSPLDADEDDGRPICYPQHCWTPIVRECRPISVSRHATIQRCQMPIRLAAAKTIHRAQGDSYSKVIADFTAAKRSPTFHHLQYVALSRVTSIDGLLVLNFDPLKITVDPAVKMEMLRLRYNAECRYSFLLPSLPLESEFVNIYFHNVTSLRSNIDFVRKEPDIQHCQIVAFAECRICSSDREAYNIASFGSPHLPVTNKTRYGIGIYISLALSGCRVERFGNSDGSIEIVSIQLPALLVLALYRSPTSSLDDFCDILSTALPLRMHTTGEIIVLGDFNVEANDVRFIRLQRLFAALGLQFRKVGFTTKSNTAIDHIFAGSSCAATFARESFYSFHNPIVASVHRDD